MRNFLRRDQIGQRINYSWASLPTGLWMNESICMYFIPPHDYYSEDSICSYRGNLRSSKRARTSRGGFRPATSRGSYRAGEASFPFLLGAANSVAVRATVWARGLAEWSTQNVPATLLPPWSVGPHGPVCRALGWSFSALIRGRSWIIGGREEGSRASWSIWTHWIE